jgi:hypothetical protein
MPQYFHQTKSETKHAKHSRLQALGIVSSGGLASGTNSFGLHTSIEGLGR